MVRIHIPPDYWLPIHAWHTMASSITPAHTLLTRPGQNTSVFKFMDRAKQTKPDEYLVLTLNRPHAHELTDTFRDWATRYEDLPKAALPAPPPRLTWSAAALMEAALDGKTRVHRPHPQFCDRCRERITDLRTATEYLDNAPDGLIVTGYVHRTPVQAPMF